MQSRAQVTSLDPKFSVLVLSNVFPLEVRMPEPNHRRRSKKRISLLSFKVQLQLSALGEPSKATAASAAAREAEEPVPELRRAADLQELQEVPLLRLRYMMPGLNRTEMPKEVA